MQTSRIGLAVLGEMGTGKSTLCNTLIGSNGEAFTERENPKSPTFETIGKEGKFENQKTFLIDTSSIGDIGDAERINSTYFVQMVQYIKESNLINGFVITFNVHNPRLGDRERLLLELISSIYPGAPWFKHLAVVWTRYHSVMDNQIESLKQERKENFKRLIKNYFGKEISKEEADSIPHYFIDSIEARSNNNSSHNQLCQLLEWAGKLKLIKENLPIMKVKLGEPKIEKRTRIEYGKTWTETLKRRHYICQPICVPKFPGRTYQMQIKIDEERTCQEFTDGSIEKSDWKIVLIQNQRVIINSW